MISKSIKKRLNAQQGIPIGATCHYEKIEDKWYVVWGGDFKDKDGRKEVENEIAFYLDCGYQIGLEDEKNMEYVNEYTL
jgi:hypothetical protein